MQRISPIYYLLTKMIGALSRCRNFLDGKKRRRAKSLYETKFKSESSFLHNLNKEILIHLYKDSNLSRMIYDGFEAEETAFMQSVLKPGDTMLDIGANIGLFTLLAAQSVGMTGNVFSFEPSPITFERLLENVDINRFKQVQCFNIGLSDTDGTLDFYTSKNGHDAWDSFADDAKGRLSNRLKIAVKTLDSVVEEHRLNAIDFIKMDVEGWEKFVILGGQKCLIEQSPTVMVEFTDENTFNAGYRTLDIYDEMVKLGYKWYSIKEGSLVEAIPQVHYLYENLIAIKA